MNWDCEGSSSWRSATPTVRMSAKTSKPSKVQPRLEATSAFHPVRLSARYQGAVAAAAVSLMPFLPLIFAQRLVPAAIYQEAYADLAWGWKDPVARIEGSEIFAPSGLQLTSRGVGRVRADGLRFACKLPSRPAFPPVAGRSAKEAVVHPWTRCLFHHRAGRDGAAADQSPRPRIRAPAPQHRGSHAVDLRNQRRCIVDGRVGYWQSRGGRDEHVRSGRHSPRVPDRRFRRTDRRDREDVGL